MTLDSQRQRDWTELNFIHIGHIGVVFAHIGPVEREREQASHIQLIIIGFSRYTEEGFIHTGQMPSSLFMIIVSIVRSLEETPTLASL